MGACCCIQRNDHIQFNTSVEVGTIFCLDKRKNNNQGKALRDSNTIEKTDSNNFKHATNTHNDLNKSFDKDW